MSKVITVGIKVPEELHARMVEFAARNKGKANAPKTLREVSIASIRFALAHWERHGFPNNNDPEADATPVAIARPEPVRVEPTPVSSPEPTGEHEDAVSGLSALLRSIGSREYSIHNQDGCLRVEVPSSALIAPGTIPSVYNGYPVVVVPQLGVPGAHA